MIDHWPTHLPVEVLNEADVRIEAYAEGYDAVLPGLGDVLRVVWPMVRPAPDCDCPLNPHHRWNCALTPIWTQTIRDLDVNPWTAEWASKSTVALMWRNLDYCELGPCCMPGGHDGRCQL